MGKLLSEVEFRHLCNNEGWLTSANGSKGKITEVLVKPYGNGWGVMLLIEWENGNTSHPYWPHHCSKITINE